ncbi:MAG: hypothetical protein D6772_12510, partial [Bacteroidetes bacterium]
MYQKTFTLRQHTPLIHFQHDQPGATLRATEVKPKLDRFLLQSKTISEEDKKLIVAALINADNKPDSGINYQMSIAIETFGNKSERFYKIPPKNKESREKALPMFFANMGDDYQEGDRVTIFDETLALTIKSFNTKLLNIIEANIADFFAAHTFGMRATKGYGSFSVAGKETQIKPRFSFTVPAEDWRTALQYVDLFYKSVRGGINGASIPESAGLVRKHGKDKGKPITFVSSFYMKPLIFVYANTKGVKWEKRVIKQKAGKALFPYIEVTKREGVQYDIDVEQQEGNWEVPEGEEDLNWPLTQEKEREAIVRDLLGLSSEQSWKGYGNLPFGRKIDDLTVREIKDRKAMVTKVSVSQAKGDTLVERFASPWCFKPHNNMNGSFRIDVFVKPIPSDYLGSLFQVKIDDKE